MRAPEGIELVALRAAAHPDVTTWLRIDDAIVARMVRFGWLRWTIDRTWGLTPRGALALRLAAATPPTLRW